MKPLYDLQQELNRLFIAGSKFAKNDPRLQKHIPILKKLGEKAPVFNKLAQEVEELLQIETQYSAEKLLNVSTLLYSVLYTQGVTTLPEAKRREYQPNIALADVNTNYSYLQLKPVLQALTESKSGRLEVLKDAFERGVFKDSRTYGYLNIALGDKYTELGDYVEETLIPSCGQAMIPFLLSEFRLEDKVANLRRFRLLNRLGYDLTTWIESIFAENLPLLQSVAITDVLSEKKDEKTEEFIISLVNDKNKTVRASVYLALAKMATKRSTDKLYELYANNKQKGNSELLATAIAKVPLPSCYQPFVQKVHERFEALLTMDQTEEKAVAAAFERFSVDLEVLKNKDYPETFQLLADMISHKDFNSMAKKRSASNYHIVPTLVEVIASFNAQKVIAFYEQYTEALLHSDWAYPLFTDYFYRVVNGEGNYDKERIYDVFAPQFGKILTKNDVIDALAGTRGMYAIGYYYKELKPIVSERLDLRWAELFYDYLEGLKKIDDNYSLKALIVLDALEKDSPRLDELILKVLPKIGAYDKSLVFRMLLNRNIPNKFEILYEALSKVKSQQYYYRSLIEDADFWKQFPKEYAKKFQELYVKTKLDLFEEIAEKISSQSV